MVNINIDTGLDLLFIKNSTTRLQQDEAPQHFTVTYRLTVDSFFLRESFQLIKIFSILISIHYIYCAIKPKSKFYFRIIS